jgi:hypothetical protein
VALLLTVAEAKHQYQQQDDSGINIASFHTGAREKK